jgi:tripartite-type tricarboxylate transporter receptor subunit TctC
MMRTTFVLALLLLTFGPSRAIAQNTPTWSPIRPVRIVVPFQAGGPIDSIGRIVAQQLSEQWRQSFIVENRTGGGGNIGMELVAKAPADGYTLGTASGGTHGANATLYGSKLPFDPLKDFTPITMLAEMKNILVVHRSLSITNLQELIAYAKKAPGQLTFGSSGTGTIQHLTGEMFKAAAKIDIVHVSYRGQAQALPDLLGGRISMMFLGAGDAAEHVSVRFDCADWNRFRGAFRPVAKRVAARRARITGFQCRNMVWPRRSVGYSGQHCQRILRKHLREPRSA